MKISAFIILFLLQYTLAIGQPNFNHHIISENFIGRTYDIDTMDLDNDGDLDFVLASWTKNNITWFENDGNGNFGQQHIITQDLLSVKDIDFLDVDGDGLLDLLSASQNDNKIGWFKNLGNGNFGPINIISLLVDGPRSICGFDFDLDGDNDVFSSSMMDNKIAWYENLGNGTFGPQNIISTNHLWANRLKIADLDLDGDTDLISTGILDNKIAWYRNEENGTWSSQIVITTQCLGASDINLVDLDNDGDLDILTCAPGDDQVSFFLNDGAGNFGLEVVISTNLNGPNGITTGDFDMDGFIDVAYSIYFIEESTMWQKNLGNGSFSPPIYIDSITGLGISTSLACGDFDGNGYLDLIVPSDGTILMYFNDSSSFGERQTITYGVLAPMDIELADMDGDSLLDVIGCGTEQIAWFKNEGNGKTNFGGQISISCSNVFDIASGDIDSDGDIDIISAAFGNERLEWYENDGYGDFGDPILISDSAKYSSRVEAGDLNNDGLIDIVLGNGMIQSYNITKLSIWLNTGNGTFSNEIILHQDSIPITDIIILDEDSDGDNDIIAVLGKIWLFTNNGSGTFTKDILTNVVTHAHEIDTADLDGDGNLDILCLSSFGGINTIHLSWFERLPGGGYSFVQIIESGMYASGDITTIDMDNDGDKDILVDNCTEISIPGYYVYGSYSLFENDGNGNFGPEILIADSLQPTKFVVYDFDNDGDDDFLFSSDDTEEIIFSENQGFHSQASVSSCANEPYQLGNQTLTTPGIYIDSLQTIYGLDSIVEVTFTHIPIPQVELDPFPSDTVCIEEEFLQVPFASPTGGEFTDTNIINNQLDLYATGEGMYELIYTYTDTATGCSNSDTSSVKIVVCTLIEEVGEKLGLNVYPNPTDGILNVEIDASKLINTRIIIFDAAGRVLESREIPGATTSIDLSKYNPGTYYLKIETDNGSEVRKVVLR